MRLFLSLLSICALSMNAVAAQDGYIILDGKLVKASEIEDIPIAGESNSAELVVETIDPSLSHIESIAERIEVVEERVAEAPTIQDVVTGTLDTDYQTCIRRIYSNPAYGRQMALRWVSDGGGDPAMHCAAVAELANDLPRVAGARLAHLAEKNAHDPALSAKLYIQAAESFAAGESEKQATSMIKAAYAAVPSSSEIDLVAVRVYALAEEWGKVVSITNRLESAVGLTPNYKLLRGKALIQGGKFEQAVPDIFAALQADPMNVDALVLRGELAQQGFHIDVEITE